MGSFIGYDPYFFARGVDGTISYLPDQRSRILEPSRLPHLFNLMTDGKHSDIRLLGPAHNEVVHDLKTAYFTLALGKGQSLFDLTGETQHVEPVIGGDDERLLRYEKTTESFLLDGGDAVDGKVVVPFDHLKNLYLLAGPVQQFISYLVEPFDVPRGGKLLRHLLFAVLVRYLNLVGSLQYCFVVARHPRGDFCLADDDDLPIVLFAHYDSVVLAHSQGLNLFAQRQNRLRRPLIFILRRIRPQSHIFPEHQSSLSGSRHQRPAPSVIDNAGDLIGGHIGGGAVDGQHVEHRQIVILVRLEVPKSDHVFVGAGRQ